MYYDSNFLTYIKGVVADLFTDKPEPVELESEEEEVPEVRTTVYTTFQLAGLHCWPECPFEEVNYLKNLHLHTFHFDCGFLVDHPDRSIEFIMKKHEIMEYLIGKYWDVNYKCCVFGSMSCEMIALELCKKFGCCYAKVSEDGGCGSFVEVY